MTPQIKRIIGFFFIVFGIQVTNCRELHDSEEGTVKKDIYTDSKNENFTIRNESSEKIKALESKENDESKQPERKPHKREQRTFGIIFPQVQMKPKPKPTLKPKTIEAPYPQSAPYPKEDSYPKYSNYPTVLLSTDQGHKNQDKFVKSNNATNSPSMPLVASDIDIRRAVPFENYFLNRYYGSKFHYPPATLNPGVSIVRPQMLSAPLDPPKSNDYNNNDKTVIPLLSSDEIYDPYTQRLKLHNYHYPPSFFPPPSFLPNSADELNRFRNPFVVSQVDPSQTLVPSSSNEYDNTRFFEPPGFVPWIPQGYEHLQQFSPVDRFSPGILTSAQSPSTGFNMEVSEIGEPAFIVPENVGKVEITIPAPFAPLRTHGLTINDAQVTRNEVRKDNGEFLSSYTTSEGTERLDSGALTPTADGDQVLVLRGSYSFTTPEGLRFRVDYSADETGYHATQVPIEGSSGGS